VLFLIFGLLWILGGRGPGWIASGAGVALAQQALAWEA